MNKSNDNFILAIVTIIVIFTGTFFANLATKKSSTLGAAIAPTILKTATNTNVSVATSSTAILAKNTARNHAIIINDSSNVIYLGLGTAAVANKGIRLNASGGSYEINGDNLFIGAINGIAVGGSSNVTVLEE